MAVAFAPVQHGAKHVQQEMEHSPCQPDFSPAAGIVTPANSLSLKLSRTEKNTSGFFGAVHNRDSFFCIYISYLYTYYKL